VIFCYCFSAIMAHSKISSVRFHIGSRLVRHGPNMDTIFLFLGKILPMVCWFCTVIVVFVKMLVYICVGALE
jgi:hypothetical protein